MSQTKVRESSLDVARPRSMPLSGPSRRRSLLVAGASTVGFALLVYLFVLASRHAFGSNSDDATLILQGQSVSSGHLTLQGWDLSYDSFWTVDVLFYALGVRLLGVA